MSVVFGPGISRQPAEGVLLADTNAADRSPIVVQAVDSQSGNLMEFRDPSGNVLSSIDISGTMGGAGGAVILAPATSARNVITPTSDAATPLTLHPHSATQSAGLLAWQSKGGRTGSVDALGGWTFRADDAGTPLDVTDGPTNSAALIVNNSGSGAVMQLYANVDGDAILQINAFSNTSTGDLFGAFGTNTNKFKIGADGTITHVGAKIGLFGTSPVVKQAGASAAGIAAVTDANAKAALTALQAALAAYGWVTSPA